MPSAHLSSYSREELTDILRILKLYKTSHTQIGRRARVIDPRVVSEPIVRVEYPTASSLEDIKKFTQNALAKFFDMKSMPQGVVFQPKDSLIGGVRLFVADDMMDISFSRFSNFMKSRT